MKSSFPQWLIEGTKPPGLAWELKKNLLPTIYRDAMLKGHEWLAALKPLEDAGR